MRIKSKELKVLWRYGHRADIHQHTVKENTIGQRKNKKNNQRLLDKTKDRIQNQFFKIKNRQSYLEAEALLKIRDFDD
ncbi:MAG TPA: hypothetical protein DCE67_09440 [Barnesiella intestinihominis]|nr:hypothetical protein [Barnesiella intestinihominis]